jgi:hypothetical protein
MYQAAAFAYGDTTLLKLLHFFYFPLKIKHQVVQSNIVAKGRLQSVFVAIFNKQNRQLQNDCP